MNITNLLNTNEPIITSRLDDDYYKFSMGQFFFELHKDVNGLYSFKNRTKSVDLTKLIDKSELKAELDNVMGLGFTSAELSFLESRTGSNGRIFKDGYIDFLRTSKLGDYELDYVDGEIKLNFEGECSSKTYWEMYSLEIISELYGRSQIKHMSTAEKEAFFRAGEKKLREKIEILKQYPDIKFADFGTRRRFSRNWQRFVVETLREELPNQIIGTSNVKLAMDLGMKPIGTHAHEAPMLYSCIHRESEDDIRKSHNKFLQDWWNMYGADFGVALSDTFGTKFFFEDMTYEQALNFRGNRHDSGDPIIHGERTIDFYKSLNINPAEKVVTFSDGLDALPMVKIHTHFGKRLGHNFGWGTTETNDLGIKTLSLVTKLVRANGKGTVKLSDNLDKAMGKKEDVELFKKVFGYSNTCRQELVV